MAANEVRFLEGTPDMVPYLAAAQQRGGEVIVVGDRPLVFHRDVANGETCALAAGGGIYECTAAGALAVGVKCYWDAATKKVTSTSAGNKIFGYLAPSSSSAADGDKVKVHHKPIS